MKETGRRAGALTRTFDVLIFILDQPRTLGEIVAHVGVCERTVRRDLEVLQRVGMPITVEQNHDKARWGCLPSRLVLRLLACRSGAMTQVVNAGLQTGARS